MALLNSFCLLFLFLSNLAIAAERTPNQILYHMHTGNMKQAFELYRQHQKELGHHDLELLQQIGLTLLDQGYRSQDQEVQLLTLFGAGVSSHERALYILEDAAASSDPRMQLVSLNYSARSHHDRADDALQKSLSSVLLLIRLEALLILAENRHSRATAHTESLMCKLPEKFLPLFPQIYALIGMNPQRKRSQTFGPSQ